MRRISALALFLSILFFFRNADAEEAALPIQVKQGEIVLLRVRLDPGVQSAAGQFVRQPIVFFKMGEEFAAVIGIDMAQPEGRFPLEVLWRKEDAVGNRSYLIEVRSASFETQSLKLPKAMVDPDPPTLARIGVEQERLKEIFNRSADQKLWEGAFVIPVEGKVAGTFGLKRLMNGQPRNQHSGEDIGAPEGTPVVASNGGKVILVGDFFFNGRSVIIDHGLGLFTMYFHLQETTVEEGETVVRGERIGSVGQTGRATGPHLHWGVRLNGARVNPFSLIEKELG